MTRTHSRSGTKAYALAVEKALSRLRAAPVLVSPRDWKLLADWHERGIPLGTILEALEAAAKPIGRRGPSRGSPSLAYIATAVEEAWALIRAGRAMVPREQPGPLPLFGQAVCAWNDARERASLDSPLHALLTTLLSHLDSGEEPREVDRLLDAALPGAVSPEVASRAKAESDRELALFRARMTPDALAATRQRRVQDRLRRSLGLPRLDLTEREV